MATKLDPIVEFRQDHRKVRGLRSLTELRRTRWR